ncbi:ricin B-like lectin [Armillaria luteobubalina]|uniref:Ricin B-like lectin n=1 Tax=Armillaria luteobubalina TaxID=153913 RepID=A0AA39Q0S5_9AGAR|nr:ricin B-like lectin [Armillaria luteobubalina]
MTLSRGIYLIHNAGVPVAMDLYGGSSADSTKITGWKFSDTTINWNQLWLVEPVNDKADTFTVRSIIAGTYMDLTGSNPENGTPIIGYQKTGNPNQEWVIKHSADNKSYKMKNNATGTFADLYNGDVLGNGAETNLERIYNE